MPRKDLAGSFKLSRGFDIRLQGRAVLQLATGTAVDTYALKPTDFIGISRPKLLVDVGDIVKAGTPLLIDKRMPLVKYCAPVSGEVVEVLRGEKRRIERIVILADKEIQYESFPSHALEAIADLSRESLVEQLCNSGAWPHMLQRPFGCVAAPEDQPRDIFVSAFDTHPLGTDYAFALSAEKDKISFNAGLAALLKLTTGRIHVGVRDALDDFFYREHPRVKYVGFDGPHPAGNVGVHIHHIRPINKGEVVWTITPHGLVQWGRVLLKGQYDTSMRMALAGPEVLHPQYYATRMGCSIKHIAAGNVRQEDNVRFISGNVLTGERISPDGYLGFYHNQVSVLTEGNYQEPFGWILPSLKKLSFHRGFGLFSFLFRHKEMRLDTNMHGEERAFAQTGVLERVVPMDILPMHLIKAIKAEDYDEMEALGIYEVIEEDFALCEFVDLSKHDIQAILRNGLNLLQEA